MSFLFYVGILFSMLKAERKLLMRQINISQSQLSKTVKNKASVTWAGIHIDLYRNFEVVLISKALLTSTL